ncbi:tetratricopeptide repeat protein [Streptomyces sp. NPDC003034]
MQKDPRDGRRLDEQLTGHIVPGTGLLAGHYEIFSIAPTVPSVGGAGSRWSGMSGAAVLSDDPLTGDLLCGVVRRDRQADGGARLTATPAAELLADDDFRARITKHTDWEPDLELVEAAALLAPAASDRDLNSPAALLRADAEAVAFHGRDDELAALCAWCETGPAALSVWVTTGPGGQGKTRLARRLTTLLSRRGWAAGHLRSELTDHDASPDFSALATALPLLVVVDYAETRPRLVRRLIAQLHRSRHRVRVLLLARSDGEWRTDALNAAPAVRTRLTAALVAPLAPLTLRNEPDQGRLIVCSQAAKDFARLLPHVPSVPAHDWAALAEALQPPDDLNHPRYDNALTLHMTALVTLLQQGPGPIVSAPGTPAEEILLSHEERFWETSADAPAYKLKLPTRALAAAVAAAALCGAASEEEAASVIETVPGLPADRAAGVVHWLSKLYPADLDRFWGSLQPDRIAEYHASRVLADDRLSLPALLTAAAPGQQAQIIIVLARAAIGHYNAGRVAGSERLLGAFSAALDGVPLAYQAVQTATAALPYPSRITARLAVRLNAALVQADRQIARHDPAAHAPELARSLTNCSLHLAQVGEQAEALTMTEQAVEIYRHLAKDDPAAYEADLARSLTTLGNHLADVGRQGEALTVTEQAVEIYRHLTKTDPAAHEPPLAASLINLGNRLAEMGRPTDAVTISEHGVAVFRRLAKDNPAAYEAELARSLPSLGVHLAQVGRQGDAFIVTGQSVDIYRRLARDNPAAYEPDFAGSLTNFGSRAGELGGLSEALSVTAQAVEIFRRLAKDNPAAYEPRLALSLTNAGLWSARSGHQEDAVTITEQAVEILRRLAQDNPAAHEPQLAVSLINLGIWLHEGAQQRQALAVTAQAAEILRRLAKDNSAAYAPDLARSLTILGSFLAEAGSETQALTLTEQAVEIYRRLAKDNPAAYGPGLARSLTSLDERLEESGRQGEALAVAGQAVEVYRRLAKADPAAYEPDLAASLINLGVRAVEAGGLGQALAVTAKAAEILRRLVKEDPAAHEPEFARSLTNLGSYLAQAGGQTEALSMTEQAVEIYRRLVPDDPAAYERDLVRPLSVLAVLLSDKKDLLGALRVTGEVVEFWRAQVAVTHHVPPELPAMLDLQAKLLDGLGRSHEADEIRVWLGEHGIAPGPHS